MALLFKLCFPRFPWVVANMKNLRFISHTHFEDSLPREFQSMKLCYLGLKRSLVEQLWEGYKHLPNLKVLDLRHSLNLIRTPDLDGLPCLERMILEGCINLKEIHPSIGYHERIIFLDMKECLRLEIFPTIIRMKKLETLLLSRCFRLRKFPEIQTSMDKLVELCLQRSGIEIVPSSIGLYCTNLVYLDLSYCYNLQSIVGNFHLLKHLKGLYLEDCPQLKNIPTEGLFDVECGLQVLSSFRNLHRRMVNMKLFGFSSSLRRLNLSWCKLVDGDMSSVFCELSNLQVLNLSGNTVSRLHSSLSQLPRLKFLDLWRCSNLVELPDLPSSIAILKAQGCDSLKIVGDLPTNLKWLWKVSLPMESILGDVKRVVASMLQGNAIEDYFISLHFYGNCISMRGCKSETFMLQLPWNWYNDFGGFLIYFDEDEYQRQDHLIIIEDAMGMDYEEDVLEVFNGSEKADNLCYISFSSLRRTSWWNSTHNAISLSIKGLLLKVELVPRRSQDGSLIEKEKDITYHSEFWDEESSNRNTFEIIRDSRSSINISWRHHHHADMFHHT